MIVRLITLVIGCALLIFGIGDLLIPRARFVSAEPAAGATIPEVPSSVILYFTNPLSSESTIDVTSTIRLGPNGEPENLHGSSVVLKSGLNSSDAARKSLRADLRPGLHKGLDWISWRTTSERWGTTTYGSSSFAAGMPVPESITRDRRGTFSEQTYQRRSRRAALIGGVIMIALGMYLWTAKR